MAWFRSIFEEAKGAPPIEFDRDYWHRVLTAEIEPAPRSVRLRPLAYWWVIVSLAVLWIDLRYAHIFIAIGLRGLWFFVPGVLALACLRKVYLHRELLRDGDIAVGVIARAQSYDVWGLRLFLLFFAMPTLVGWQFEDAFGFRRSGSGYSREEFPASGEPVVVFYRPGRRGSIIECCAYWKGSQPAQSTKSDDAANWLRGSDRLRLVRWSRRRR